MHEGTLFWRYIASSLDRLIGCLDGLTPEELNWRPAALDANSVYALAVHMLGTTAENLLGLLGGQPVRREREAEFAARAEVDSAGILSTYWDDLRQRLAATLTTLPSAALDQTYAHRCSWRGKLCLFLAIGRAGPDLCPPAPGHDHRPRCADRRRAARG